MEPKNFNILKHYMIEVAMPKEPPMEFYVLVPSQRDFVVDMMDKGVILSYGLSEDRTKLWIVAVAGSFEEVGAMTERFPMFKFMDFKVEELMFYNNSKHKLPELSLN